MLKHNRLNVRSINNALDHGLTVVLTGANEFKPRTYPIVSRPLWKTVNPKARAKVVHKINVYVCTVQHVK